MSCDADAGAETSAESKPGIKAESHSAAAELIPFPPGAAGSGCLKQKLVRELVLDAPAGVVSAAAAAAMSWAVGLAGLGQLGLERAGPQLQLQRHSELLGLPICIAIQSCGKLR